MQHTPPRRLARALLYAAVWIMLGALLFVVPDLLGQHRRSAVPWREAGLVFLLIGLAKLLWRALCRRRSPAGQQEEPRAETDGEAAHGERR